MPYASFIQIELHKINDCEDDYNRPTGKCWRVMFTSNGQPLKFKHLWKKDKEISKKKYRPSTIEMDEDIRESNLRQGMYLYQEVREYL